ncbi:MAG: group II intron reverse transcriptase/maturase [Dehalococcoidia bacterium]|nr:MAG: group II intron reverse transcriptase/maturase [Dehalococcoidia bacterium]
MKTVPWTVYAPTRSKEHWKLPAGLDWKTVQQKVMRLQMRIAKAAKMKKYRLMRSLQWILAHSYYAKLLAVRRVTSNKGKNTPGVDGVIWKTSHQKMNAVKSLYRRGYKALPLRRVYIPKKSGKLRPLGIPTTRDRAMQALYAFALTPIAETFADPYSYGFRQARSCADALRHCFDRFCQKTSPAWILEADIASCFDTISHQWILENIPLDKKILKQWLNAGFLDKGELFPTLKGTPQGGIISPTIMNMTLDGLELVAKKSVPWCLPKTNIRTGVTVIRYADDFIITAKTRELLEHKVLPAIKAFLAKRGLALSEEKTRITNITEGFDFLGQHVRKYKNGKVLTTPSRKALQGLLAAVKLILKAQCGLDNWSMIRRLNQIIRGWCNYHRHACSSTAYSWFDTWLHFEIRRWLHRRHPNKGRRWIKKKYFRPHRTIRWSFFAVKNHPDGRKEYRDLLKAGWTHIVRHIKIQTDANPYDPSCIDYFKSRRQKKLYTNQDGRFVEETGWLHDA